MQNALGTSLETCGTDPVTGWDRSGLCHNHDGDAGHHLVCARMTDDFLDYTASQGNDLRQSSASFPGLHAGDRWCICAARYSEAAAAGKAPPILPAATHAKANRWLAVRRAVDAGTVDAPAASPPPALPSPLVARLGDAGTVSFAPRHDGVRVSVRGVCVPGMLDGEHGFHIHERGGGDCDAMGGHYNPHGHSHGGPSDASRHAGDLGNVVSRGGCVVDTTLDVPGLSVDDIAGRGIVLHERADDFGRGGTDESRATGSAGKRIACATIGSGR